MTFLRIFLCCLTTLYSTWAFAIPRFNLFNPYDILVRPPVWPDTCLQLTVGYEGSLKTRSFQADDDDEWNGWRKCGNVLQLWQDRQNATAAFLRLDNECIKDLLPVMEHHAFMGDPRCIVPYGSLKLHNMMFMAQCNLPYRITLGAYLSVYQAELGNVCWSEAERRRFEDIEFNAIFNKLENLGNLDLRHGWKRTGPGDLALEVTWLRDFIQAKPHLKNVRVGLRAGLTFPTGKQPNENQLFAFPFGNDAGLGLIFAGHLEMWVANWAAVCLDAEFLHLFGSTRERRVKVACGQTDLLLLNKLVTFRDPGFTQHYTLYLDTARLFYGFSGRLAYQYTQRDHDRLYICSNFFDPRMVNRAESLDEWTTHDFIVSLVYDGYSECEDRLFKPFVQFFYKKGFNGKRAVLADTLGVLVSVSF
jgi:hypothetical protein